MINYNIRGIIIDKVACCQWKNKIKMINREYHDNYSWNERSSCVFNNFDDYACNFRDLNCSFRYHIIYEIQSTHEIGHLPQRYCYSSGTKDLKWVIKN